VQPHCFVVCICQKVPYLSQQGFFCCQGCVSLCPSGSKCVSQIVSQIFVFYANQPVFNSFVGCRQFSTFEVGSICLVCVEFLFILGLPCLLICPFQFKLPHECGHHWSTRSLMVGKSVDNTHDWACSDGNRPQSQHQSHVGSQA